MPVLQCLTNVPSGYEPKYPRRQAVKYLYDHTDATYLQMKESLQRDQKTFKEFALELASRKHFSSPFSTTALLRLMLRQPIVFVHAEYMGKKER